MIRVFIVEDDRQESDKLLEYLKVYGEQTGEKFMATVCNDGLEFLEKCKQPFDVVFMDIKMPHIDGMEATKRMREFDADVPLVFMTNLKQYALKGYEVSAMDFLVKPVSYSAFSTMMDRVCMRLLSNKYSLPAEMRRFPLTVHLPQEITSHWHSFSVRQKISAIPYRGQTQCIISAKMATLTREYLYIRLSVGL